MEDHDPLLVRSKFNDHMGGSRNARLRTPAALRHRMKIYLAYTVGSLLRQEDDRLAIWLNCRQNSDDEIAPFMDALDEADVTVTFDGGRGLAAAMMDIGVEHAYIVRIDADDMYDPRAIKLARLRDDGYRVLQWYYGYIWHEQQQRVQYYSGNSPPLFCQRAEVHKGGFKMPLKGSHTQIAKAGPIMMLSRDFLLVRHGMHSGRTPDGRNVPRAVHDEVVARYQLDDPLRFWRERDAKHVLRLLEE